MARVRLCVCGSWFVGREAGCSPTRAPGQCLHFECRGAPARARVWRCEGRPPLPHHFVCVEKFTLPLTLPHRFTLCRAEGRRGARGSRGRVGCVCGHAQIVSTVTRQGEDQTPLPTSAGCGAASRPARGACSAPEPRACPTYKKVPRRFHQKAPCSDSTSGARPVEANHRRGVLLPHPRPHARPPAQRARHDRHPVACRGRPLL